MSDVLVLETEVESAASYDLGDICRDALDGNSEARVFLMKLWEEGWAGIKEKLETEGSMWYVWWMDGVRNFMRGGAK